MWKKKDCRGQEVIWYSQEEYNRLVDEYAELLQTYNACEKEYKMLVQRYHALQGEILRSNEKKDEAV